MLSEAQLHLELHVLEKIRFLYKVSKSNLSVTCQVFSLSFHFSVALLWNKYEDLILKTQKGWLLKITLFFQETHFQLRNIITSQIKLVFIGLLD